MEKLVFVGENVSWKQLGYENQMICDVQAKNSKVRKYRYAIARKYRTEYSSELISIQQNCNVIIGLGGTRTLEKKKDYTFIVGIVNKSDLRYKICSFAHVEERKNILGCATGITFPCFLEPKEIKKVYFPLRFEEPETDICMFTLSLENVATGEKCNALKTALFFYEGDFLILKRGLPGNSIGRKLNSDLPLVPHPADIERVLDSTNLTKKLTSSNYHRRLQFLLLAEEYETSKDLRKYNIENADLTLSGGFYKLKIPDLHKTAGSTLIGSVAKIEELNDKRTYRGMVEEIKNDNLNITFQRKSPSLVEKRKFRVSFLLNRYKLMLEHQALELALDHETIPSLFPQNHGNNQIKDNYFNYFNENIKGNVEQEQAIRHIFWKTAYPAPYIIFGPPGTGKTSTIVETIKQIWFLKTNNKILVCASSNNAANEIACRLADCIPNKDLLRYLASSYPLEDLPVSLKTCCNYSEKGFYEPSLDELRKYQIVVSTVVKAGRLVNVGINSKHFAYVFIDECGSCTETESLIPIAGILSSSSRKKEIFGQIVLSGDPYQLGPVISSPLAMKYGFGISMLERLMNDDFYCKGPDGQFNKKVLTKLVRNFRSHPKMLGISNKLFYDNDLIACGNDVTNMFLNWKKLKNRNIPIIFHHLKGKESKEENSTSWFNMNEVSCTVKYIGSILDKDFNGTKIKQSDIGVISPYSKQCVKLKQKFSELEWTDIEVGSIEQYQGREKMVTILSTVRSNNQHLKKNHKSSLGFLNNPKRFNVAMTRSIALQIVIGDALVLKADPTWNHLIKFCINNNCIVGKGFGSVGKNNSVQDISHDFERMKLEPIYVPEIPKIINLCDID